MGALEAGWMWFTRVTSELLRAAQGTGLLVGGCSDHLVELAGSCAQSKQYKALSLSMKVPLRFPLCQGH